MEYTTYKIGDICKLKVGGDAPKDFSPIQTNEYPFPIFSNGLENEGLYGYTNQAKIQGDTITVSARGVNIGTVFYRKNAFLPIVRLIALIPNDNICSQYLYYYLRGAKLYGTGSAQPQITVPFLKNKKIRIIKSFEVQKKIADILSKYDELIEVNNQRIKKLEQTAEELYKEWFVRFRFPNYQNTEFENGIPKGWKTFSLNELLQQHFNGGWGKDEEEKSASYDGYVIRGTDINDIKNSNFSNIPKRYHSEKDVYGKQLNKYDIILELSNGNINNIGRTLLIDDSLLKRLNPVMSASFCKVLRFNDSINALYVYYLLQYMQNSGLMNFYKNSGANGINNFNFKRFLRMEVLIPNRNDLAEKLETIFDSIVLLRESNCNLIQQRDLLLPRLMSGKLEV